jgi:hypothetical protein
LTIGLGSSLQLEECDGSQSLGVVERLAEGSDSLFLWISKVENVFRPFSKTQQIWAI